MVDRAQVLARVDDPADIGRRVDVIAARYAPTLSRRAARALGLRGKLLIDGVAVAPSTPVALGSVIAIRIPELAEPPALHVLAEADHFVIAAKPSGVHTHRLRPDQAPALADAVVAAYPECARASPDAREGGAVHRLDAGTSGAVAFARDANAWEEARRLFAAGLVEKTYLALCRAPETRWPPPTAYTRVLPDPRPSLPPDLPVPEVSQCLRIDAPIGRAEARSRVKITDAGDTACSLVWPLAIDEARATMLVCARPLTGRRHQLRVHLAWIGMPIAGDTAYGGSAGTLLLHAAALSLPTSSQTVSAEAPVGPTFAEAMQSLALAPFGA